MLLTDRLTGKNTEHWNLSGAINSFQIPVITLTIVVLSILPPFQLIQLQIKATTSLMSHLSLPYADCMVAAQGSSILKRP